VAEASARTRHARALFAPLGPTYDRYAALFSCGQDPRWRRFLVSETRAGPGDTVLDVATGTGAVARVLALSKGCDVVGLDQSPEMLAEARRRIDAAGLSDRIRLVEGSAEALPFGDGEFDALTFTYLLRYVDDPAATLRELARVVRPGGTIASLEFGIPGGLLPRAAWELYVRAGLPAAGALVAPAWAEVGRFLSPSIHRFYERLPLERQLRLWHDAGIEDLLGRRLSFGGGIVIRGLSRRRTSATADRSREFGGTGRFP
jgi:demethylmenaquinone methyltransferase/2-methoxy-6-polyprenyl-1,4-benzoquinol methylase